MPTHRGHEEGGDDELHLERVLNLVDGLGGLQVRGNDGGGEAHNDASSTGGAKGGKEDQPLKSSHPPPRRESLDLIRVIRG